jgi:pilus assembly protein FimV
LAHRRRRQLPEDAEAGGEQAPDAGRLGASPRDSGAEPGSGAATAAAGELSIDPVPDLGGDAPPASRPKDGEASGGGDIDVQTGLPAGVVFDMSEGQPETQDADVIAEADIYILYGRYREAEALLREELERTPESPALRYKLGEALLGGGNRGALAELLDAMRAAGQDGEDAAKWAHLESGLAGLAADDGDMAGRPPGTGPQLRPSAGAPAPFDADQLPDGEAASKGDGRGDDEGPDLGFSVQDVVPPSAEALPWQMGDLEQLTPPPTDPEPADLQIQWQGAQRQGQTQSPGTAAEEPLAAGPVENAIADDVRSSQWHMDAGFWDEAATKMDLARAYIEMDDPDAAGAVLEDVVQEGSEQQRADARAMLARLGWRGSVERR